MPTLNLKIKSADGTITLHKCDSLDAKRCREINALYYQIKWEIICEGKAMGLSEYQTNDLVGKRLRTWMCGLTPTNRK